MQIKTKTRQHRRDFWAIYVCEHCGHEYEERGYDDAHFHEKVIPGIPCPECGKKGNGPTSAPDVPAHVHI